MDTTTTDSIVKHIIIDAPVSAVWGAIADAGKFGEWFKVDLTGQQFEAGKPVHGKMTYPGHEGKPFDMIVDRIEPPRLFSFRWHPYGIDPNYDYSSEPLTLIEFVLEEAGDGTKMTVTESGFDQIPISRRAVAFRMDTGGWEMQMQNVKAYVES